MIQEGNIGFRYPYPHIEILHFKLTTTIVNNISTLLFYTLHMPNK